MDETASVRSDSCRVTSLGLRQFRAGCGTSATSPKTLMLNAIQADGLSKRYRIAAARPQAGTSGAGNGSRSALAAVWERVRDPAGGAGTETLWALQDVSFEIRPGEVVGIIGRNGAGKSTLLKLLGRITRPTSGDAVVRGRIGTLLEVGTGFHPELTGRENIFLSGAIAGMRKEEIRRKFDAIVDFAEMSQFLEMPVKRYSSGMYVRLAFAVAAHLEPDILLIDEVLAVGDASFQKKCLSRMEAASQQARTVLFISHNLGAIRQLCPRSILIDHGRLVQDGPTPDVLRRYSDLLGRLEVDENTNLRDRLNRSSGSVRFADVSVEDTAGEKKWDFRAGETDPPAHHVPRVRRRAQPPLFLLARIGDALRDDHDGERGRVAFRSVGRGDLFDRARVAGHRTARRGLRDSILAGDRGRPVVRRSHDAAGILSSTDDLVGQYRSVCRDRLSFDPRGWAGRNSGMRGRLSPVFAGRS